MRVKTVVLRLRSEFCLGWVMGVSWDGRGLGKELGNILDLSKSPQMHINGWVCVLFKLPSHSCREGLFKFMILNECLGVVVINTSVMTAVNQKWIFFYYYSILRLDSAPRDCSALIWRSNVIWITRSEISSCKFGCGIGLERQAWMGGYGAVSR